MREFTGSEIKQIREALGEDGRPMSQKEFGKQFSEKFPVHWVSISNWETNKYKPRPRHRKRLEQLWVVAQQKMRRPKTHRPKIAHSEKLSDGLILNLRFDR